ncbi:MAG: phosphodiester glycosidase family protein [Ruminococcaceae bacterium]|nr:phosphodiester glycosidase family protein [Oscillospiraceae bacterium]
MFIKKKLSAIFIVMVLLFSITAEAGAISRSLQEEKTIMEGVDYKRIQTLTDSGWQDIHIITADISKPHLAFEVLSDPRGASYLLNTLEMAKNADAVAAINADFFAAKRGQAGRGSAVGMEMINSELISTPSVDEDMNVLYQLKGGEELFLNSFEFDITITAPNGETEKLRHINKYDDLVGICMYTPEWGEYSLGSGNGIVELVVEDGKVTEKLWEHEPAKIPENGYVLASNVTKNDFIDVNFNWGDEVKIDIKSTPDFEQIENAVSGGGVLVSEGEAQTVFSHNIAGLNPRSAIGIDKSGKIVTLVAVDGRRTGAAGMTQTELAKFMQSLGCYYALNFDGGGSTLLTAKTDSGHEVMNKPSDNYKRPVINSVGIITSVPLGNTNSIKLDAEDKVFSGHSVEIKAFGYDEYLRMTEEIEPDKMTYEIKEGSGTIEGNTFYADGSGEVVISGRCGQWENTIKINVLENIHRLKFNKRDITLSPGEKFVLELTGYDENGYSAKVRPQEVEISVSGEGNIDGNVFTAKNSGALIKATCDKVSAFASVCVGDSEILNIPDDIKLQDKSNIASEKNSDDSFSFTVFGNIAKPKTLFDVYAVNRAAYAMKSSGDMHSVLGNVDTELMKSLMENSFSSKEYSFFSHKKSAFLTVKNSSGGIYASDKSQWESIENDIERVISGNFFVFLDDISLSTVSAEKKILMEILSDASKRGINVYVFGAGENNGSFIEDGVRYIEVAGLPSDIGIDDGDSSIFDVEYFVVTVNANEVTYVTEKIIQRK